MNRDIFLSLLADIYEEEGERIAIKENNCPFPIEAERLAFVVRFLLNVCLNFRDKKKKYR